MCHEDKMKESERVCVREVAEICNYEIKSYGPPSKWQRRRHLYCKKEKAKVNKEVAASKTLNKLSLLKRERKIERKN